MELVLPAFCASKDAKVRAASAEAKTSLKKLWNEVRGKGGRGRGGRWHWRFRGIRPLSLFSPSPPLLRSTSALTSMSVSRCWKRTRSSPSSPASATGVSGVVLRKTASASGSAGPLWTSMSPSPPLPTASQHGAAFQTKRRRPFRRRPEVCRTAMPPPNVCHGRLPPSRHRVRLLCPCSAS